MCADVCEEEEGGRGEGGTGVTSTQWPYRVTYLKNNFFDKNCEKKFFFKFSKKFISQRKNFLGKKFLINFIYPLFKKINFSYFIK